MVSRPEGVIDLDMKGAATFLHTPELAAVLDEVPAGAMLRVRTADLTCMDHGARETLAARERQNAGRGCRLAMDEEPAPETAPRPAPAAG